MNRIIYGAFGFLFRTLLIGIMFTVIRSPFAMLLTGILIGISIYHYNVETISKHYSDTTTTIMTKIGLEPDQKETNLQKCLRLIKKVQK